MARSIAQQLINIPRALELNNGVKELKSYYCVNTTNKSPEEVAAIICEKIIKIERVK